MKNFIKSRISPKGLNNSNRGCNPRKTKVNMENNPEGVEYQTSIYQKKSYLNTIKLYYMGTYRQIFYQIVFSTKNRIPAITETHETEMYKYIWGIINANRCMLYRINGMPDHIHIFSDLHPAVCLSDYVKSIKVASSLWIKQKGYFPKFPGWQDGYGAFTYTKNEKEKVINYIKNQKDHHQYESSFDEYKRLLIEHGIKFDEKYLL